MKHGRFISIDGSEGCGKSTQITYIVQHLQAQGKDVYATREPGGTAVGERIRELFLDERLTPHRDTELLLIFAARNEHLQKEILPRLARGQWVVSDRFNDATYAYQGYGRGIPLSRIRLLERWTQAELLPDLSLLLTLDADKAGVRLARRQSAKDRLEQESAAFFAAIETGYRARAAQSHACLLDADGTPEEVFSRIRPHLDRLL